MVNKNKEKQEQKDFNKKMKLIKKIIFIGLGIVILELIIMLGTYIYREFNINYQDGLNDIKMIDDGYIGAGYSNFRNSDFVSKRTYSHTIEETGEKENIIASQARIVKYDKNMDIVWERTAPGEYDSTFYNVIKVNDGYVAVGSFVYEYEQIDLNIRDGLIVKYDLNGNMLWHKNYQVLGDTEFYKVIESDGNYIVVGQSIYENMELGNHITGGGIILKYSPSGELLAKNNYGGNKSGMFNDIEEVSDGYIVCGRDAANYGIVVKFKKDFDRAKDDNNIITKSIVWNRTFSNTDTAGFTDLLIKDNKIYLSGAVSSSDTKDEEGNPIYVNDAGIVVYDTKGKYLNKYTFGGSGNERYNSMILDNDNIIVVGVTDSSDIDIENYPEYKTTTGIMVKYDLEGNIVAKTYIGGEKEDQLSRIIKIDNNKCLVTGTTNSIKGLFGYDYRPILNYYDNELNKVD